MYLFYSFLLFLALLFYFPIYFIRTKLKRGEPLFLKERLGLRLPQTQLGVTALWFHAVSVGEVLSLQGLLGGIKKRHPSWKIHLSIMTNAAYRVGQEKLTHVDHIFFVPVDFAFLAKKFFSALKPALFILAESEFWPNILRTARKKDVPVLLINGRVSSRSFRKHRRWRYFSRKVLSQVNLFLVQTPKDKERLERIGVRPDKVHVGGNLKCDLRLPAMTEEAIREQKKTLGLPESIKVIVAGSTHEGEEEVLLGKFAEVRKAHPHLRIIIAPRHPQRSGDLENIGQSFDLKVARKTRSNLQAPWEVLILDTIGELAQVYAVADVAFVGGSLVPHGGQNLLEPAFYSKPIFFGPHMENFSQLADEFIHRRAARVVRNVEDVEEMLEMKGELDLEEMGKRAKEVLSSLQGATERTFRVIEEWLLENSVPDPEKAGQ